MPFRTTHRLFFLDSRDCSVVADASVDLVVTSPPYPMIEMWDAAFSSMSPAVAAALRRNDSCRAFSLIHAELDRVWSEMHRVLKGGGFLCVNVGDATRTTGGAFRLHANHARITGACVRIGFDALPMVHWWKPTNAPNKFMGSGMLPAGAYVTLEHEYVLVFRKGGKREFLSKEEKRRRNESAFFWEERNVWFSGRWDLKGERQGLRDAAARERSGAFPFELPYRLVNMYSVRGDTVLDPFLGTGTTVLAAIASGRNSVGIEIDRSLKSLIGKTIRSCRPALNAHIRERIEAHRRFIDGRRAAGKEIRHENAYHGFPVMTRQEKELRLDFVDRVCMKRDGSAEAWYSAADRGEGAP
jgi:DNA modification methylase